jgi:hypothetical protein
MSGQRPPEWEGPDDDHADAGLPGDGHSDLDLAEVTSLLASVRDPALPASFEARISAAIAAEAAARAAGQTAATEPADAPIAAAAAVDAKDTVRSASPEELSTAAAAGGPPTSAGRGPRRGSKTSRRAARGSGPGDSRPGSRRRRLRMPSMQAASWTLVGCLVLAGFGFLVSRGSGSSSSSVAASSASSQSASAAASADIPQPATGRESQPEHDTAGASGRAGAGFLVYSTGVAYRRSTLASQVRGQLANAGVYSGEPTTPASSPSATAPPVSASASAASSSLVPGTKPSPALAGCVSALAGGVTPSLVDRASYDGIPAYIIAVPTHVWAVRLGCTAADTQLLAQAALKG